jgi:peptidoglycan/xylan/chitin deacetylase (PgdA/CDA1 family)
MAVDDSCSPIHPHGPAGGVVISIDFELRWGMRHVLAADPGAYRKHLLGAPHAVELLLAAFGERGIRATWATVGAIGCESWSEYWQRAPLPPRFQDRRLAIERYYERLDPTGELHFSRRSIDRILQARGQDLGCHTFSHMLFRRSGATIEDMSADLSACTRIWQEKFGTRPVSFVFPCNEVCHTEQLLAAGFRVVRRTSHGSVGGARAIARVARLLSACRVPGSRPWPVTERGLLWTDATAFVRFNLPPLAWEAHLQLLRAGVRRLRHGQLLHLWWHPHNFGDNADRGLQRLMPLLDDISEAVVGGRLRSLNMSDLGR